MSFYTDAQAWTVALQQRKQTEIMGKELHAHMPASNLFCLNGPPVHPVVPLNDDCFLNSRPNWGILLPAAKTAAPLCGSAGTM